MTYPLHRLSGEPRFDRLAVLKLRCPAEVPVNERIYAQAQLGLTETLFFARLWAFENEPTHPDSRLSLVLEGPKGRLTCFATADGETGIDAPSGSRADQLTAYRITGEDLQGEYWGVTMLLFRTVLADELGLTDADLEAGGLLRGNVVKEGPGRSAAFLPEEGDDLDKALGLLEVV